MNFFIQNEADSGMLTNKTLGLWEFIDWHDLETGTYSCCTQMLYAMALRCMAQIAAACNMAEQADFYDKKADSLLHTINLIFWNADRHAYVSALDEHSKPSEQVRRHPNYGFADEQQKEQILNHVLLNETMPKIKTPFYKIFEYEVMFRMGLAKQAMDGIRSYWGGMIELGATTFWEEFDPAMHGTEHYAMYGEPFDKSLCHA